MHNSLTALLTQVRDGSISVADAALQLREAPFEDLGYARATITAACGRARPRSSTARAKRRSRSLASSIPCSAAGRRPCSSRA